MFIFSLQAAIQRAPALAYQLGLLFDSPASALLPLVVFLVITIDFPVSTKRKKNPLTCTLKEKSTFVTIRNTKKPPPIRTHKLNFY